MTESTIGRVNEKAAEELVGLVGEEDTLSATNDTAELEAQLEKMKTEMEAKINASKKNDVPAREKIEGFINNIKQEYHIKTLDDTDDILIYKDDRYENGKKFIHTKVNRLLGIEYSEHLYKLTLDIIRARTYVNRLEFESSSNKINLKNGVLDVLTCELELHDMGSHNYDYNFMYKLDIEYNPDANCPSIKKFMDDVTGNEEDFMCLEEFVGYVLYSDNQFRRFLVLHGNGNNGKSLFISLMRELVGKRNTTSIPLQQLETNRFAPSGLYGKKLNMFSDLPNMGLKSTGMVKSLTGGTDQISAEEKHKASFEFVNKAKFMFSANELPEVCDESDAFWNRVILICFPNVFIKETDNKNLFNELTTIDELSGFLNMAIKGLQRLLDNQGFTYNYDADETYERWQESSQHNTNELDEFVYGRLETGDNDYWTEKQALYDTYVEYCEIKHIQSVTFPKFGRQIKKYRFVSDYRPYSEDKQKQVSAYRGIRVNASSISTMRKAERESDRGQKAQLNMD